MTNEKKNKVPAMTLRFDDHYLLKAIDYAACLSNQSRTRFILSAAQEKTLKIIKTKSGTGAETETMFISPDEYEKVINSLEKPKKLLKKSAKTAKMFSENNIKN